MVVQTILATLKQWFAGPETPLTIAPTMSLSEVDAVQEFNSFVAELGKAIASKDASSVDDLFLPHGYLREYVAQAFHSVDASQRKRYSSRITCSILIAEWNFNSIPKAQGQIKTFYEEKGVPDVTNLHTDPKKTAPTYIDAAAWIQ